MRRIFTIVTFAVLAWPGSLFASWFADGQCFELNHVETAAAYDDADASGCDDDAPKNLDDPSSNACFEGAEVPISTLPHFIAELQAERLAAHAVETALGGLAIGDDVRSVAENDLTVDTLALQAQPLARDLPRPPRREALCSSYPEECEAMPPLPNLSLEMNAPAGEERREDLSLPPATSVAREVLPIDGSRLGPAAGHEKRLERPPELA